DEAPVRQIDELGGDDRLDRHHHPGDHEQEHEPGGAVAKDTECVAGSRAHSEDESDRADGDDGRVDELTSDGQSLEQVAPAREREAVPAVVLVERPEAVQAHVVEGVEHHDGEQRERQIDEGLRAEPAPAPTAEVLAELHHSSLRSRRNCSRLTAATAANRMTPAVEARPKSPVWKPCS